MVGLPAMSKLDMEPAMSSRVKVLNSSDVNSASSSSGEVGTWLRLGLGLGQGLGLGLV